MANARDIENEAVRRIFDAWPAPVRQQMLQIRSLIFEVAAATPGVGLLEETLKWGEPAYLTAESGSGSTLRLAWKATDPQRCGLYVNCRTDLVEHFRTLFPKEFAYAGQRALLIEVGRPKPDAALAQCIELALTHHVRRRAGTPCSEKILSRSLEKSKA